MVATHRGIRVYIALLGEAYLQVRVVDATMAASKQAMQQARQVNANRGMVSGSSCQHIDIAVNILVAGLNTGTVKRQIVLNTHHLFYLLKVWESFRSLISTYCTISYQARR